MPASKTGNSGKSGAQKTTKKIADSSLIGNKSAIKSDVPTKITFFLAKDVCIADLSLTSMPAHQFDGFIMEFFSAIPDIDRSSWELADRLYAINAVLSQTEERKRDKQIYLKLAPLQGKRWALVTIVPEDEQEEKRIMSTYEIDNRLPKIGDIILQSGMMLRAKDGSEGPCDFVFGKLYIYPETGDRAVLVNVGEEVEVLSEQRHLQALEDRKNAIVNRQLGWRERMGEENTRSFDPSNESW